MADINAASRPQIRCREVAPYDLDGITKLLASGFGERTDGYWLRVLKRLSERTTPPGFPRYGYLLECDNAPVGVVLLIFASVIVRGEPRIRCNVSSWYVAPKFRSYAAMLVSRALQHKNTTYLNITPAHHTVPILQAQGYELYGNGIFVALPALCVRSEKASVKPVGLAAEASGDLLSHEMRLLLDHASYGCVSLICRSGQQSYPFIFAPCRAPLRFGRIPFAHLIYSRDLMDLVRFAGALGRFLASRGLPVVVADSNGPIPGLVGVYFARRPKYFRGPDRPRLGDLAYSELAVFDSPGLNGRIGGLG